MLQDVPRFNLSNGLSLYVHVPFCAKKCDYCDFFSIPSSQKDAALHATTLATVYSHVCSFIEEHSVSQLETVYVGGGSPSLLNVDLLAPILNLAGRMGAKEVTVEANPEQLSEKWIERVLHEGATRLSVGIQSFNANILAGVGRHVSERDMSRAMRILEPYMDRISLDFMAGLPGQTERGLLEDIRLAMEMAPSHISLYMLTVEEGTPLYSRRALINDEEGYALFIKAADMLTTNGYERYEISNFARDGAYSRHNMRYWALQPYLGVGPGAVSTLPLASGGAIRYSGKREIGEWTPDRSATLLYEREDVPKSSFAYEHFMMGLRTSWGLNKSDFLARFGVSATSLLPDALKMKWKDSLVETMETVALTVTGREFLDAFLVDLLMSWH